MVRPASMRDSGPPSSQRPLARKPPYGNDIVATPNSTELVDDQHVARINRSNGWTVVVVLLLAVGLLGQAVELQVPSGTWVPTGGMSQARSGASAALLPDGTVLITGGVVSGGPSASV